VFVVLWQSRSKSDSSRYGSICATRCCS